jgi:DNA-binding NtrC family response regulator
VIHYFPLVDSEQVVKAMLGIIAQVPSAAPPQPIPATQRLHAELAVLRQSVRRAYGDGNLIGQSPAMRRAFEQVKTAQAATSPVLFVGETGTGRQHLARVIHYHGPHGKQIFVPLDCRSSVDLEQTLARIREDHRADALRVGAVYFNNIDYASSLFQQDLLDWLTQEAASTPVRIFAGSTRPLKPLVDNDQFQRELYFALTSLVIEIPPLRERMDDLESVAQYFVEELNRDAESQVGGFADDVWRQFRRYNWPGNLTELRHVIAESRSQCSGPTIRPEHLPFRFRTGVTAQSMEPAQRPRIVPLDQLLEQVEREQIERAMVEARQNKARAAELLGITRPRLYRRMEQLGIFDPDVESAT